MNRLAILTAATLTLTAACGDNAYVPVEVDDPGTADFARATVDVDREAISDDYVAPTTIFSYARAGASDRAQWVDEINAFGSPVPSGDVTSGEQQGPGVSSIDYVLYDYGMEWSCLDDSLAAAPDGRAQVTSATPAYRAPEKTAAAAEASPGLPRAGDVTTGEALAGDLSCGAPIDNDDSDLGGVCGCTDLSCVADYVDATMGCNVCMTFVCGDELLGACAACAP